MKLLEKKFEVYGIDISEYVIEQAKKVISNPRCLKCLDVQKEMSFNEQFDVITAFDIMEHLTHPLSVFINLNKSLKKEGSLYLELPVAKTLINRDSMHHYRSLKQWIDFLGQAGFKPHFIQPYYTIGLRAVMIPTRRFANYCAIIAKKQVAG